MAQNEAALGIVASVGEVRAKVSCVGYGTSKYLAPAGGNNVALTADTEAANEWYVTKDASKTAIQNVADSGQYLAPSGDTVVTQDGPYTWDVDVNGVFIQPAGDGGQVVEAEDAKKIKVGTKQDGNDKQKWKFHFHT